MTAPFGEIPKPNGAGLYAPKLWRSPHPGQLSMSLLPTLQRKLDRRFSAMMRTCQTRFRSSSLLTTAPDASISAISTSIVRSPSVIGRPSASTWPRWKMLNGRIQCSPAAQTGEPTGHYKPYSIKSQIFARRRIHF